MANIFGGAICMQESVGIQFPIVFVQFGNPIGVDVVFGLAVDIGDFPKFADSFILQRNIFTSPLVVHINVQWLLFVGRLYRVRL